MKQSKWFIFTLVAITQFMVVLDSAITNVALPTIKQQLHFSTNALQWVVTAYSLTFGGFLLLGGRAADLFGRRRVLLAGMTGFTLFSLLIGLSNSDVMLIALRALQGASAAFMSPAALSIVVTTFRDGADRNQALSFWALVSTGGAAVGLLLGGVLTQLVNWRWNFFVNVPIGIGIILAIRKFVPAHADAEKKTGLDLPGAVLVTSSLMGIVLAFSQATTWGWLSAKTLSVFGASLVLLAAFLRNEAKAKHPLMPLSIFKVRNVAGANLMMAPVYGTMLGMFFIVTLYMQTILHFDPIKAGFAFLPMPILISIMANRMPKLVAKYGFKRFLVAGPILVSLGALWLSRLPVDGRYLTNILPALLIMPFGIGMTFMPLIAAATSGVPTREAGLASGLITTAQQMGGALGLSILSGVAASVTAATTNMGRTASLVHGFDRAMLVGVLFMIFAAVLAITVIRQPKRPNSDNGAAIKLKPATES